MNPRLVPLVLCFVAFGNAAFAQGPDCEAQRAADVKAFEETAARATKIMNGVYSGRRFDALKTTAERAAQSFRQLGSAAWGPTVARDGETRAQTRERVARAAGADPFQVQDFLEREYLPKVQAPLAQLLPPGIFKSQSSGVTVQKGKDSKASAVVLSGNYLVCDAELGDSAPEVRFTYDLLGDKMKVELNPSADELKKLLRNERQHRNDIQARYYKCIGQVGGGGGAASDHPAD